MKIATFNVNSISVRLQITLDFLREHRPDILLLQELKCEERKFPTAEFEDAGYNVYVCGQKTYNGVAILSKRPLTNIFTSLMPTDTAARYIEGELPDGSIIASVYVPNGNPMPSGLRSASSSAKATPDDATADRAEKFEYKLAFMKKLSERFEEFLGQDRTFIVGGDYNVIYEDKDAYDPADFEGDALLNPPVRDAFKKYLELGVKNALRELSPDEIVYTWYSYTAGMFRKKQGILIDHFLISPDLVPRLTSCTTDIATRALDRPSDHVPLILELN